MKRFLFWFGIVFLVFIVMTVLAYFFISSLLDYEPYIAKNSYLTISISGSLPEYLPPDLIQEQFSGSAMDMRKLRRSFEMAAQDERIKGIVLKVGFVQSGFAKLQEIGQLISRFRRSNKKIVAYMDVGLTRDYYIASACDSVFLQPEGTLILPGLAAEVSFYKDLLSKLGIEAEFEHVGKYKSYPDAYTRQNMSSEQREVIDHILDTRYEEWLQTVSANRKISYERVKRLVDDVSAFVPSEALEYNLIDGIKHYDQVAGSVYNSSISLYEVHGLEYTKISPSSIGLEEGPKIAVITCSGSIMGGEDSSDPMFGTTMGADRVVRNLKQVADNKSIKAIILRIDSPGGSGLASEKIWHAVKQASSKKPILASISDMGASGGYYIAIAADTILAQEASLIGSIGVFVGKLNMSGLYKKLGINTVSMQRGKNATLFSLKSGFSKSERKVVRKIIEDYYQNFVEKVALARNKSIDEIHTVAQGRVWNGRDGVDFGLIDKIGGFDDTIILAKEMAGIDSAANVKLVFYPKSRSLFNSIARSIGVFENPLQEIENYFKKTQIQPMAIMPFVLNYN